MRQNNRNPFIDNPQYVNAIWKIEAVDRASSYCCNKSNSNQYYIKLLLYLGQQQQNNGVAGYDIYVNELKTTETGLQLHSNWFSCIYYFTYCNKECRKEVIS
jgi:hypothetical protein